jgi:hypothetical protein
VYRVPIFFLTFHRAISHFATSRTHLRRWFEADITVVCGTEIHLKATFPVRSIFFEMKVSML